MQISIFGSVPDNEDRLGLEGLFSLDDMLSEILAVVGNLSPHVVYKEWLTEVIFVVRERHSLEVKSHGGTALDITKLIATGGRVAVGVKELSNVLTVLGEERIASVSLPLLIKVHHVVGVRGEKTSELLVGEDLIENVNFINSRLLTPISDASSSNTDSAEQVEFPNGSVSEHHEGGTTPGDKAAGPHVVGSVKTGANLVEIVTSAHSPFPVVGVDHVSNIVELGWISHSFGLMIRWISTALLEVDFKVLTGSAPLGPW